MAVKAVSPALLSSTCLCSVAGWEEEQVSSPSILRLIFQGRFLHGNVTLGGKTLVEQTHQLTQGWAAGSEVGTVSWI